MLYFSAYGEKVIDYLQDRNGLKYEVNQEEPYTGKHLKHYPNGQKKLESSYKDGKRVGSSTTWYENGQKGSEANYKNGKLDGLAISWVESGQKFTEVNYKNGKSHGLSTLWAENGQIKTKVIWMNGAKIDVVQGEANHKNGNKHTHAGRSHSHPLPAQGIAHKHGNGLIGKESQ